MATLRTDETLQKYKEYIAGGGLATCPLCEVAPIKLFTHWKIIGNAFPYDQIANTHHMLVPLRHVPETDITAEEWEEYQTIKRGYIQTEYEFMIEATHKMKSIPAHFHIHLITLKI